MSSHDLVENNCGGSNPSVKLSTDFVQGHALEDQDLKHSVQITENNNQRFLESSTEEEVESSDLIVQQFSDFCQGFKKDNIFNKKVLMHLVKEGSLSADDLVIEYDSDSNDEDQIGEPDTAFIARFGDMTIAEIEKEYTFIPNNVMDLMENPLAEGKLWLENGELPSAVLCFEAAVKIDISSVEAWQLLGITQAENEQNMNALRALNRCVKLQPNNLPAILVLADCYANENCYLEACFMYEEWLKQNPKYSDIVKSKVIPPKSSVLTKCLFTGKLYEAVKGMYMKAVQRSSESSNIDVDLQIGFGALLNLNNEIDKAVDCNKTALKIRPKDARLWNKFGATLAKGDRHEEAIKAYRNALKLCPGLIKARCNLGTSFIFLDKYREASQHFLHALNLQASAVGTYQSPALSDSIWKILELSILVTERPEIIEAVTERNLGFLNEVFPNRQLY